ncbi:MAG: Rrf2 family transcriptional regulator [Solirubrobacteraceae bacterium]|nr:Rrf2 family transcriptional regulator [Solirubrobacteraceae bacterium]
MAAPTNTQFAVAIHVLTLLSGHRDTPLSSDDMAGSVGANPVYLRRVLGRLRETGFVGSRPGPKGGWHLTREPEAITLGDVWRAIQCDAAIFGLHATAPECPVGREITATLTALDEQLSRTVLEELDRTTVAQVMPDHAAQIPGSAG